jgi:outer membrane autotransporter protein
MSISAGVVSGAVVQNDGTDVFVMSGGQIASLNQGADPDRAYISGGTIAGLFFAGDEVEFSGGSIGDVNLETANNRLVMWGTAEIVGFLNTENGLDDLSLFGGTIGGNITTGSANDTLVIGGTPASFNGVPIAGVFGATAVGGSIVMEGGNDSLTMNGGSVAGSIYMDAGLGNTNALAGDGFDDTVRLLGGTVGGSIITDAPANGQIGEDSVVVDGTVIAGGVDTGGGDDTLDIISGSVGGLVDTGTGNDQIQLQGGALLGNLDAGDGDDLIAWNSATAFVGAPAANTGTIRGGLGSDIVAINNAAIDLSQMTLDGGDDLSPADGAVDALALNAGWSGELAGANTTNFEVIYIDGGTVRFSDGMIATSSAPGIDAPLSALAGFSVPYGLFVGNGGTLDATNDLAVTGSVTLRNSTMQAGRDGANQASISGSLTNAAGSTIDLANGGLSTGDRLTVGGDYTGGGTVLFDAALDATASADTIVIAGTVVSGVTSIVVRDIGDGTGAATGTGPGNGIALIDVSATGGTAAGDFVLAGGPIAVNAFTYVLNLEGNGIWYLQSLLRPIAPVGTGILRTLEDTGLTWVGTLHERTGDQSHSRPEARRASWARIFGQTTADHTASAGIGRQDTSTQSAAVQGGIDVARWPSGDGALTIAGLSAAYGEVWSATRSTGGTGSADFTGGMAGLHLTHFAQSGWYADAGLYGAWFDVDATSGGTTISTATQSWVASLELGRDFALGVGGLSIEPQAQVIYQHDSVDHANDGTANWTFSPDPSLFSRLGLRMKATAAGDHAVTGYVKANFWSRLTGDSDRIAIGATAIDLDGRETWADAGLGLTVDAANGLSIFADGDVAFDLSGDDFTSITGKTGFKLTW